MDAQLSALEEFRDALGDAGVLTGADVSARRQSWLRDAPAEALALIRPASSAEVSKALQICSVRGLCVVPVGGNTNLVEGTVSGSDDVLLSLERMTRIEAVDPVNGYAIVEAGVPLQALQEAAEEAGAQFTLDLGARGSATVGGAISTNAGGNAVIRYGMMREQVLGLEAVLADGTVLSSMNRMLKNNAGYDLKQLLIGTEGTLGIVTRAVVRLRAATKSANSALLAVDHYEQVPALLRRLEGGLGGALTAFEVMWQDFWTQVVSGTGRHGQPLSDGHAFYVLVESCGSDPESDEALFQNLLHECLEDGLVADAVVAGSGAQRAAFWAIRDDIDALVDSLSPAMAFDVSLPVSDANEYTQRVHARLRERFPERYRATTFGHLGDSNIHFILTIGESSENERHELMGLVYDELRDYGGSISAEHGIGLEKRAFLDVSRSPEEIDLMRRLKQALDPKGTLNPGKIF